MKYLYLYIISSFVFLTINCSTPYQPKGVLGGYSSNQLEENIYRVTFKGNQHSKPEIIQKYLLYRCAELTQEMGYEYFTIIGQDKHHNKNKHWTRYDGRGRGDSGAILSTSKSYIDSYVIKLLKSSDIKNQRRLLRASDILCELSEIVE